MDSEESHSLSISEEHPDDVSGSRVDELSSSMVSSEAESEPSVVSDSHQEDQTGEGAADATTNIDNKTIDETDDTKGMDNLIATVITRGCVLPWLSRGGTTAAEERPGEYVMRLLFTNFTEIAERKMETVMAEPLEKPLNKSLQRGEDTSLEQVLGAFGTVAEHCLPSLLRALFAWLDRQMAHSPPDAARRSQPDTKNKSSSLMSMVGAASGASSANEANSGAASSAEAAAERRDLAVEFLFGLALIEVLHQLHYHPGHDDLVTHIENLAFKRFHYRDGLQSSPNAANVHIVADLYAEVVGVLAQARFPNVRRRFTQELKELKSREPSPHTSHCVVSLLMGMKFFRVKMVPIEEFEASFQFLQELAQYFLEAKDKDIRHALAGLFVEILVPVAATVKNEVNVPCLKTFVETLYSHTLDASTKSKHRLALFPLVTCLLCVSQKQFFLANWHYFLAMCLSHLKNRDPKMCRVALESLYRLLWVYMIRIKCESNSATQSRLQSIVNSLFPKGSKGVVPRDTPLNIFVKIIQFIAQERLEFAMREIVFELLMVGRPIKVVMTPERMSIGLRAFLVVADGLQQKEGEPPMPRTNGTLPSGSTLRVKKTFLTKALTDDTARAIGMSPYFPHVRVALGDMLRALDAHCGRPLMATVGNKDQETSSADRKPRIDLFRTCVAAIPRLLPTGMSGGELVELLCRLTVHVDEELRGLSFQSLQTLIVDFPDWRHDVLLGFTHFLAKELQDTSPALVEDGLRMLLQLVTSWRSGAGVEAPGGVNAVRAAEALGLAMLCQPRHYPRRLAVHILRESKMLLERICGSEETPLWEVLEGAVAGAVGTVTALLPPAERQALLATPQPDLAWLADRTHPIWTTGGATDPSPWELVVATAVSRGRSRLAPSTATHASSILYARVHALHAIIEPPPVSDNRASLLSRSPALPRKPEKERDGYMQVWRSYLTMSYLIVPPVPSAVGRCASPDLSLRLLCDSREGDWWGLELAGGRLLTLPLSAGRTQRHQRTSSSPDSLSGGAGGGAGGNDARPGVWSPVALHKLCVPLARCEVAEVRDAAVDAMGHVNPDALKDLMEEVVPLLREAVDRKAENVRRRRRRDALRVTLHRLLAAIARRGTLKTSNFSLESGVLHSSLTEWIDGARLCLENDTDKDAPQARELRLVFAQLVTDLIKGFPVETYATLLSVELRKNVFCLLSAWSGEYCRQLGTFVPQPPNDTDPVLQLAALKAMSALVCCGSCFEPKALEVDGPLYPWLSQMLSSSDDKVYSLARETTALLLECNPDIGPLLDWTVDQCFTGAPRVADGCFMALAAIFSAREYPCDHYTAIMNVTLLMTGCPRSPVHESALQLLQLLDQRFFGAVSPLTLAPADLQGGDPGRGTLDALLCTTYCRSQLYLSRQLSHLHPELTMPMFSEITGRFQTARAEVRQLLLQYLQPWLVNIQLVDPHVPPVNSLSHSQYYSLEGNGREVREGRGSAEATEMVLNNLFYITAKFSDNHPKEIEELWSTLCSCWPNNLKVIIRYLIIVSGMAPNQLLPYAKRVVLYLARSRPERLLDEMMTELQTVETLNCLIERTETPPFYRLTSMRKATSPHSDGPQTGSQEGTGRGGELAPEVEKGTIHTKRHSGDDPNRTSSCSKTDMCTRVDADPPASGDATPTGVGWTGPGPLPMPEYGGFFAPLTEFLPDAAQPVCGFHRCNVAVMLLCDVVLDGVELDWSIHVPLMLHIVFLGMDHTRWVVHFHCRQLLQNLLVAVAAHHDHLTVARILLAARSEQLQLLPPPPLPVHQLNFTEPDPIVDSLLNCNDHSSRSQPESHVSTEPGSVNIPLPGVVVVEESTEQAPPVSDVIKSLVQFLVTRPDHHPLWNYEDITAKVWSLRSCAQMSVLVGVVLRIFRQSLPHALVSERWAQTALQLGLSCPSRHYAGRSLQVFRCIGVALTGRMVSDILSRLVETVAEQGEDMQGYVTELLLTLEAAVESLESNFRPLDYMRDIFKSTPNLNNKEGPQPNVTNYNAGKRSPGVTASVTHTRSTSYSMSALRRNPPPHTAHPPHSPHAPHPDRHSHNTDPLRRCCESRACSTLCRSRSAQSLRLLGDTNSQDDKLTILATLFWVGASLLESDYEHEYLLGVRLLARVMARLPLDRYDARDRLDRTQAHTAPSIHALLLKGCTHPATYEPVVGVLADMVPLLELAVIDPTQAVAFPMTVVALLPYMLLHYEDANEICVRAACHIAKFTSEKSAKLENLGTVMTLYSRRTFSKESFQWTKCVVKYLWDTYSHLSLQMLAFLVDVLEKGGVSLQLPVLSILHCMLCYVDLNAPAAQSVNNDLLRVVANFVDGGHNYKEALKILKLVVSRCSTLVAPPSAEHSSIDSDHYKKELPGRTMDFTFDLSQTPVIGRKYISRPASGPASLSGASTASMASTVSSASTASMASTGSNASTISSASTASSADKGSIASIATVVGASGTRRSPCVSPDPPTSDGWKKPWMSQSRVRECLVNLLTTCGQRVGLPKSPSVIFSQSSELVERESSMTSSLEEVSGTPPAPPTDHFGVFKDFDFLEYESESIEGESSDNFNWGVRRRLLSEEREEWGVRPAPRPSTPPHDTKAGGEESSDEDAGTQGWIGEGSREGPRPRAHSASSASTNGRDGCGGDVTPVPGGREARDGAAAVCALLRTSAHLHPLHLTHTIHTVLKEVTCKTVSLCGNGVSGWSEGGELGAVVSRLGCEEPPLLWVGATAADSPRLRDAVRFAALEINEHLETYFDRREHAIETLELARSPSEVARSLYKLIFQLLLLLETNNKMVAAVYHAALENRGVEMSSAVWSVRSALQASLPDSWGEHSPAPHDDASLLQLMQRQRWSVALALVRDRNGERILERGELPDDDITSLLHIYCNGLMAAHPEMVAVTRPVTELSQNLSSMMESLYRVSVSLQRTDFQ